MRREQGKRSAASPKNSPRVPMNSSPFSPTKFGSPTLLPAARWTTLPTSPLIGRQVSQHWEPAREQESLARKGGAPRRLSSTTRPCPKIPGYGLQINRMPTGTNEFLLGQVQSCSSVKMLFGALRRSSTWVSTKTALARRFLPFGPLMPRSVSELLSLPPLCR